MSQRVFEFISWLVVLALMLLFAGVFKIAKESRDEYHTLLCEERMAGVSSTDTLAIVRDDEFCVRVISP